MNKTIQVSGAQFYNTASGAVLFIIPSFLILVWVLKPAAFEASCVKYTCMYIAWFEDRGSWVGTIVGGGIGGVILFSCVCL